MRKSLFEKAVVFFFFTACFLATSWSLFHPGLFHVHDTLHAARIIELLRALEDGHFPVRWTANFGGGYGAPVFEFYAPLPYYIGTGLYFSGVSMELAIKLLFIFSNVFTFWGMYFLGKKLFGNDAGIIGAVAVTMAPYRAVDLFVRGALSETWGIMAIPWVLLGVLLVLRREKYGWLVLVLSTVVLFLSHNIVTLLFLIPLGVFTLSAWYITERQRGKFSIWPLVSVGLCFLLTLGLVAFYLLPSLAEKEFTQVHELTEGYFQYTNHFIYIRQLLRPYWGFGGSAPWPYNDMSYFLGYGQWVAAGTVMLLAVYAGWRFWRNPRKEKKQQFSFLFFDSFIVIFFGCIFMTLSRSAFIWQRVPFLPFVQFPWRWLSVVIIFLGLITGMGVTFIRRSQQRYIYFLVTIAVMISLNIWYFQPKAYLQNTDQYYFIDPVAIRTQLGSGLSEYVPKQIKDLTAVYSLVVRQSEKSRVVVISDKVQEKKFTEEAVEQAVVDLGIADFPGWTVYIDSVVVPKYLAPNGNLQIRIPGGYHEVVVRFESTNVRYWSDAISLASLAFLSVLLIQTGFSFRLKEAKVRM